MKWQQKHTSLLVIAIGFSLIYVLLRHYWLLIPACLSLLGFLSAPLGQLIHNEWMRFAKILGYINSRILLIVVFFIILTPIALLMRMLGKSTYISSAAEAKSLFVTRNHLFSKHDLEQPF